MNLIDAIKSGKSYRRKGWSDRAWRAGVSDPTASAYHTIAERLDDLLADDWEVKEPEVTITLAQFDRAWAETLAGEPYYLRAKLTFARKLGLIFK